MGGFVDGVRVFAISSHSLSSSVPSLREYGALLYDVRGYLWVDGDKVNRILLIAVYKAQQDMQPRNTLREADMIVKCFMLRWKSCSVESMWHGKPVVGRSCLPSNSALTNF